MIEGHHRYIFIPEPDPAAAQGRKVPKVPVAHQLLLFYIQASDRLYKRKVKELLSREHVHRDVKIIACRKCMCIPASFCFPLAPFSFLRRCSCSGGCKLLSERFRDTALLYTRKTVRASSESNSPAQMSLYCCCAGLLKNTR